MRHTSQACYTACLKKEDFTILTVEEGMCFRNCLTKFGVWYKTFPQASMDAQFKQDLGDMAKQAPKDPWQKSQARWIEKLQTQRNML